MAQAIRKALMSPTLRRAIQIVWVGLIIVFVGYYAWRNWVTFRSYTWQFDPWWMLVALVWAMVRKLLGGIRWMLIVLYHRETRTWTEVFDHLRVYFLSNLANDIPGSLWYMASRVQMSRDKGLSTLRTSMGLVYETGLLVWSGCVVGAYAAVSVLPYNSLSMAVLATTLVVLSLLMIHPAVANLLLRYVLHVLKRPSAKVNVTFGWGLELLLVSIGVWVAGGLSLFYLLKAFHPALLLVHLADITSASALAWTVGFLAPWAPSGLGVRDGLLVWLLEAYIPSPLPVIAAVASRMVTAFEDVSWAFIVLPWRR
jgi:hypothetical protein